MYVKTGLMVARYLGVNFPSALECSDARLHYIWLSLSLAKVIYRTAIRIFFTFSSWLGCRFKDPLQMIKQTMGCLRNET